MSDHLTLQQMERHREQMLLPRELIATDDHLASCDACFAQFTALTQLPDRFAQLRIVSPPGEDPSHLIYDEQVVAYVDNELDEIDRDIVESHMDICRLCAGEVRDLQRFKEVIGVSTPEVSPGRPTLSQKSSPVLERPARQWRPSYVAGLVATICVLLLIGMFLFRAGVFTRQAPLAGQSSPNNVHVDHSPQTAGSTNNQPNIGQAKQSTPTIDRLSKLDAEKNEKPTGTASTENVLATSAPKSPALRSGNRRSNVAEQGILAGFETLPTDTQQVVKAALTSQGIEKPAVLIGLTKASSGLRDGSTGGRSFTLLTPAGTLVQGDSPTFRWSPLGGATGYVVTVLNTESGRLEKSGPLAATEWTIPDPLPRGVIYSWQVTAIRDDERIASPAPPAPEVQFKVLEEGKAAELARAINASANLHLALGVLYAREGLIDDAEREFQALARANPRSLTARRLLRSVQSWRNR